MKRLKISSPESINTYYPKITDTRVVFKPQDITGDETFFMEPEETVGVSHEPILLFSKSNQGSVITKLEKYAYKTSTGSRDDYSFEYDGEIKIPQSDLKTYILNTPRLTNDYFVGITVYKNLLIFTNDIPYAVSMDTGEVVWDLMDTDMSGDHRITVSHISSDGRMYAHNWYSSSATVFYLYSIDVETGEYITHDVSEFPFEESFLKPNGELVLHRRVLGTPYVRIFQETEGGFSLREPRQEYIDAIDGFYVDMHPSVNHFYSSKDGSLYYICNTYTENVISAFSTETDEVVWTKSWTELNMTSTVGYSIPFHKDRGFLLVYQASDTPASEVVLELFDWQTGESISRVTYLDTDGTGGGSDYAPEWYSILNFSHSGNKFYMANDFKDTIFFDTDTLSEVGRVFTSLGNYGEKDIHGANDISVLVAYESQGAEGLAFIDFNTNNVVKVSLAGTTNYETTFTFDNYNFLIPHNEGFYFSNGNGSLLYITEGESSVGKLANTHTPTTVSGEPLTQGWYYDNGSTEWRPPAFIPKMRSLTLYKVTYDFGDGHETSLVSVDSSLNYEVKRYINGNWVVVTTGTAPTNGNRLLYNSWQSYNSGFVYPYWSESFYNGFNFLTGELKSTSPVPGTFSGNPYMLDNIEYFFSSSGNAALGRAFNHTTNTWSTVTKNPAHGNPSYITSYNGNIYTFTYNNLAGSFAPRETIARRYNVASNNWTTLSTCPEGVVPNPEIMWDTPYTHNEFVFMPTSGYIYNMALDTWEFIGIEPRQADKSSFVASRIHYSTVTGIKINSSVSLINHSTAAYALPGSLAPY